MEWQQFAALVLGYVFQWLKAFKKFPTWAVQLALAGLAVGLYCLDVPFALTKEWVQGAAMFALSAIGAASVAAAVKAAPPTDSIH